jgi:hypothetical protein
MAFTFAPILIHPDPAKPFIVETDASDFALGAILSQFGIDGLLHPIAFYSRKLTSAEINYQVYDKELLAIITFDQQDGLLLRNNLIYVPKGPICLKILRECHDNTLVGHFGMTRTHELVSRNYWWPKMNKLLREYVKSCDTCARSKAPRHRPFGLLQPLSIPSRTWGSIAIDFITNLPTVRAKNSILVVVD